MKAERETIEAMIDAYSNDMPDGYDWPHEAMHAAYAVARAAVLEEAAVKAHKFLYPENDKPDWTQYAYDTARLSLWLEEELRAMKNEMPK